MTEQLSNVGSHGLRRLAAVILFLAVTTTGCSTAAQDTSPGDRDLIVLNGVNQTGWQRVSTEAWVDMARKACSSGAWDGEVAIDLADRFAREQGMEGDDYVDQLPVVIWTNLHVLCPDAVPEDAEPPEQVLR